MLRPLHAALLPTALLWVLTEGWCYGPLNHLCVVNRNWGLISQEVNTVAPIAEWQLRDALFSGALADDLGYIPRFRKNFGNLTDMTHYVRTGEWVQYVLGRSLDSKLAPQPQDRAVLYAFALGILSHYAVDRMGHYYGTNVVAAETAGRADLYGGRMSYERNPQRHKAVESAFDMMAMMGSCRDQLATGRIQAFAESKNSEVATQVAAFLVAAFRGFYRVELGVNAETVVQALVQARGILQDVLDKGNALYGVAAKAQSAAPPTKAAGPMPSNPVILLDQEIAKTISHSLQFSASTAEALQYYRTFKGSFARADNLFVRLLRDAAPEAIASRGIARAGGTDQLRQQWFNNLSNKSGGRQHRGLLPNVNLDTNMVSASGQYVLADRRYEQVAARGAKTACPPGAGPVAAYFRQGIDDRRILSAKAPPDEAKVLELLARVGKLLKERHAIEENDLVPALDLTKIRLYRISLIAGQGCSAISGSLPFGKPGSICVGPASVYWTDSTPLRGASLWFAALTAFRLSGAKNTNAQQQIVRKGERLRRENVESYRLCDLGNSNGYFPSEFCVPNTLPPVNATKPRMRDASSQTDDVEDRDAKDRLRCIPATCARLIGERHRRDAVCRVCGAERGTRPSHAACVMAVRTTHIPAQQAPITVLGALMPCPSATFLRMHSAGFWASPLP